MNDYVTAWELYQAYGISKQKVSRAIKSGKLNAVYDTYEENGQQYAIRKWLIRQDEKLSEFVEKNKTCS